MNTKTSLAAVLMTTFLDWVGLGLIYPVVASLFFNSQMTFFMPDVSQAMRSIIFGLVLTSTSLVEVIFAPILGYMSDRYGRKRIMLLALFCGMLGYLFMAFSIVCCSVVLFIAARMILGIYSASAGVYSAAIADVSHVEQKTQNFSLYSTMCGAGFILGPFFGGLLSESALYIPFVLAALLVMANMLIITVGLAERTSVEKMCSPSKKFSAVAAVRSAFSILFLVGFGWSLYWEFAPAARIVQYGFSATELGVINTYESLFYVISCLFFVRPVISWVGPGKAMPVSALFLSLCIALLYVQKGAFMLWVCLPLQQVWLALYNVTSAAWISNTTPDSKQGQMLGLQTAVQSIAFTLAPAVGGLFFSLSSDMPLVVGATSILLGALIYMGIMSTRRQSNPVAIKFKF